MACNLSGLAFMWFSANHLISSKLSSARFAASIVICVVVQQVYCFNNMENIIQKYVRENRAKNGFLRHNLEDRLKNTSEGSEFNTLFSIS